VADEDHSAQDVGDFRRRERNCGVEKGWCPRTGHANRLHRPTHLVVSIQGDAGLQRASTRSASVVCSREMSVHRGQNRRSRDRTDFSCHPIGLFMRYDPCAENVFDNRDGRIAALSGCSRAKAADFLIFDRFWKKRTNICRRWR